ncbi:ATP-binding protein [Streptomyces sp. SID13666]|uniref:ATP-binding protein n=1 Tax=unclassified Streptomyces TaxID=2593676 RepID=UPI0013C1BEDA|nr:MULTISPECIES: ATP-binding protein [unclassified Streptomyces]NEA55357.1 ATP-binding protein [Streptomyces sp. SID13666]NEA73563.1 ATP-binding protein [Streptomyces sp. SID13588]
MTAPADGEAPFPANPYRQVGRVAEGDRFVGRGSLVRLVQNAWQEPGRPSNARVLGYHRTGKTSLVRRALQTSSARRIDLITVWLDVGTHDSGPDLFRSMARQVMEEFGERGERREMGPPDALDAINAAVQQDGGWGDLREALRDFFKTLCKSGYYVLAVLDEFDRASTTFTRLAEFQLLRNLASDPAFSMGLITISRRDIESIEVDAAGGSILGGVLATRRYVGMFTDEEADLILARAAGVGIGLASVRADIIARTGLHPFLMELLCNRIVDNHQATGELDVEAAYEYEAPTFDMQFAQLRQNIEADSEGRATALLKRLAVGAAAEPASLELSRLKQMGVVASSTGSAALFSREFAHYIRMSALGRS